MMMMPWAAFEHILQRKQRSAQGVALRCLLVDDVCVCCCFGALLLLLLLFFSCCCALLRWLCALLGGDFGIYLFGAMLSRLARFDYFRVESIELSCGSPVIYFPAIVFFGGKRFERKPNLHFLHDLEQLRPLFPDSTIAPLLPSNTLPTKICECTGRIHLVASQQPTTDIGFSSESSKLLFPFHAPGDVSIIHFCAAATN
jgi:hypothetical protein